MAEIDVNKYLNQNEKIITSASPIRKYYANKKGMIFFGLIWGLIDFSIMGAVISTEPMIGLFVFFFMLIHLTPFWIAVYQIIHYFTAYKKCRYVITNKRLLIIDNKKTTFINHSKISDIELKQIADFRYEDAGSITIFKEDGKSSFKFSNYSYTTGITQQSEPAVIYAIENSTKFYNTLSEYISNKNSDKDNTHSKKCAYCSTVYDVNLTKCPSCGASSTIKH